MDVVIIGTGNVATVLGRMITTKHAVVQVAGRNEQYVKELCNELECDGITDFSKMNKDADLYIIAVSDSAIASILPNLPVKNKLVAHTAGSVSIDVLKNISDDYGVIYPLQSIRKENKNIPHIPLLVDGSTDAVISDLLAFAQSITPLTGTATDEQRVKLHIGAVISSNFVNHLYALTKKFCDKEGVPFSHLIPLIEETAKRLQHNDPASMQTGPAIRRDMITVKKHLHLLEEYPKLHSLYKELSESIMEGI